MVERDRLARLSSARRTRKGGGWAVLAAALITAAALLLVTLRPRPPAPVPAAAPPPPARATAAPTDVPSPSPSPTATPAALAQLSDWVEAALPTATPPPWPTAAPEPTPQPPPTAARAPASCVEATWSAQQGLGRLGEVLVEIELQNRCGRELSQLEVWFRVTGYRDGSVIQSVCAHPFETVYPGRWGRVTVGLPGSLDWYDHLEVEYTGESCR